MDVSKGSKVISEGWKYAPSLVFGLIVIGMFLWFFNEQGKTQRAFQSEESKVTREFHKALTEDYKEALKKNGETMKANAEVYREGIRVLDRAQETLSRFSNNGNRLQGFNESRGGEVLAQIVDDMEQ